MLNHATNHTQTRCGQLKNKQLIKKSLFTLLFLISIFSGLSQEIKLKLIPGETYFHNSLTRVLMIQDFHGEEFESDMTMGGKMRFYVKDKRDSLYDIEVKFETMQFSMKSNEMEISANSVVSDTTNLFDVLMKEMIEKPFDITITDLGLIKNIEMDNVFDNLFSFDPKIPKIEKAKIVYLLKQSFGEEAMKGSIEMFTAIYPNKEITTGDFWKNEIKLETISTVIMKNKFELTEFNKDFALIQVESETVSDDENSFIEMNGELIRFSSDGKMNALYKIDSKTGWVIESNIVQNITGLSEKKWKIDSPLILKIPFTYKGTINLKSN